MELAVVFSRSLGRESLSDCLSLVDEPAGLPSLATHVGEPEKVELFRFTGTAPLPVLGCLPSEFNQARLVRV